MENPEDTQTTWRGNADGNSWAHVVSTPEQVDHMPSHLPADVATPTKQWRLHRRQPATAGTSANWNVRMLTVADLSNKWNVPNNPSDLPADAVTRRQWCQLNRQPQPTTEYTPPRTPIFLETMAIHSPPKSKNGLRRDDVPTPATLPSAPTILRDTCLLQLDGTGLPQEPEWEFKQVKVPIGWIGQFLVR